MQRSLSGLLAHSVATHGAQLALKQHHDTLTFAQLQEQARRAADGLLDAGRTARDRVGVYLTPNLGQPVAILAAAEAGAVVVPMHPNLRPSSVAHVARDGGMSAVITDVARRDVVTSGCPPETSVLTLRDERDVGAGWLGGPVTGPRHPETDAVDDLAMLIYSSGSTGRPKGIMITNENLVRGSEIVSTYLGTRGDDRIAGLLSLNFDYGLNQLWQCLLTGASLHLHDFVMPRTAFRMLAEERITALPLMPAVVQRLFAPRFGTVPDLDYSSVRYICSSGGAISDWALDRLGESFPGADVVLMYGLTEAFRSSFLPAVDRVRKAGSIGRPVPGVTLHVLDENGADCPPGTMGTLVHRGGCISRGYWRNGEATATVFRRFDRFPGETVVWTGDHASVDEEGYFYVHGRADAQLKRDGFRISPQDVELVVNEHPAVAEAVVLGLPDGDRGHQLVVVWTSRPGLDADDGPSPAWLTERLAAHMIPTQVRHVHEFPTTDNQGKVDRIRLRELFTAAPVLAGAQR